MSQDPTFSPIRPGGLALEVRSQIRARILDGTLRPGQSIRDSVLAESMGLSRTPVREALQMLEQNGLLRKSPNRSYQVTSFTEADVGEVALLRIAYESMAVTWIIDHRLDVSSLRDHLRDMIPTDSTPASDGRVLGADGRFHIALVSMTRLPRLIASYEAIRDQVDLMLTSGFLLRRQFISTQQERHQELFESLSTGIGTGEAAPTLALLADHISRGMRMTSDLIA